MAFPAIRSLAMPCAGVILFLAGCAGMDGGKQKGQCGSECAANAPPAAAGHSEKSPEPTVRPVSYTTDSQPVPAAGPAVPPGGQNRPPEPEKFPRPLRPTAAPRSPSRCGRSALPSALAAVSGQNPQVAYANARICESFAQAQAARVLWLPSIHAGLSYDNHSGTLQAENGDVSDLSRSALQAGLGMGAVGGRLAEGGGRGGQLSRGRRHLSAADRRPRRRGPGKRGDGRRSRSPALGGADLRRSPPAPSSKRRLPKRPFATPNSLPI